MDTTDTNTTTLVQFTPPERGKEIVLASPADAKAWELVSRVLEWMRENQSYIYTEAFAGTGTSHMSFYRAMKKPYVQTRLLERLERQDAAELQLMDAGMLQVLHYQMRMAAGLEGSPRESTAAARFISEREKILRDRLEREQVEEGSASEASVMLQRFKERFGDGAPMKARRTTTVEEVEIG